MAESEDTKDKLAKVIKWGVGLLVAALLAPVAFVALKGVMAFGLALLIAWLIGLGITQVMPLLSFIIANAVLKVTKFEARRNPIETLQNSLIHKQSLLSAREKAIIELDGTVRGFREKVKAFRTEFPNDTTFEEQLESFEAVLKTQKNNYNTAKKQLQLFEKEVDRARAKWDVTMSAQNVSKLTGKFANSVMEKIKQDTALESVEVEMNKAFAELDISIDRGIEMAALPAAQKVVELVPTTTKEKVGAR